MKSSTTLQKQNDIIPSEIYLPHIDGLRGISILMVMFIHLSFHVSPKNLGISKYLFSDSPAFIWSASFGTRLFFMVSSFTLFRSLKYRINRETLPISNFYIRRFWRIVPLFWIWVLIYAYGCAGNYETKSILATLFFYMAFLRGGTLGEVWPGAWSIYVEEFFYILLPLWYKLINSLTKAIFWCVLGWLIASVWERFMFNSHLPKEHDFVLLFPLDNFYYFFFGAFFFQLEEAGYFLRLNAMPRILINIADCAVIVLLFLLMPVTHREGGLALACAMFMSFCEKSLFGKIACSKIVRKFGVYCYSVYLMHQFILSHLESNILSISTWFGLNPTVEFRMLLWFPVFSILMLGLGKLSFKYLESPLINLGKTIISSREEARLNAHAENLICS